MVTAKGNDSIKRTTYALNYYNNVKSAVRNVATCGCGFYW